MRRHSWEAPGLLAAVLLLGAARGFAQSPPAAPSPSSLRQAVEAAWALQPEHRAAPLRRDAAMAAQAAARRWTPEPPALDVSARTDRLNRNEGAREYDATIAVPLWLPGERAGAQAAAGATVSGTEATLAAARWRLAGDVREAHWAHERARLEHDLARQRVASARQIAADVARRVQAGDLARADAHQADAAVAAAESAEADAAVARALAFQAWQALTGLPLVAEAAEALPDAALAAGSHPALREAAARGDLAQRRRDLAGVRTRANPELMLGTTRERDNVGARYARSLVVGVRIPLGRSSASGSEVATASADLLEAEAQLALETRRVQLQAEAAQARVTTLEAAHAAASRRAALARESRGFFEKAFRLGESDLPTRLRIELEAFEAERQAARSRLEADAAISQLRQALGLLPE